LREESFEEEESFERERAKKKYLIRRDETEY
jgi:hypothetical protein